MADIHAWDDVVAAVAWDDNGFEVAVVVDGRPDITRAADVAAVHAQLLEIRDRVGMRLACVVESTNGMLDGGLMSRGLRLYRADPALLPARPLLGSVPAGVLAEAAANRPADLTRLALETGSLTGRGHEVERNVAAAADDLAALTASSRCIARAGGDAPRVALTFDDGPHPPYTQDVLDVLARYAVPATFFCVGLHAQVHADVVRRIAGEGHQLGNHTWSHPMLADLDEGQTRAQLDRTDDALARVGPGPGRRLFRPPYGATTRDFVRWFGADEAERVMVLWDVEPYDWALPGADAIAASVLADVSPGSIVLLHDGGGDRSQTVEALSRILDGLLERGYSPVTVADLLG